jgi:hypothetical protein
MALSIIERRVEHLRQYRHKAITLCLQESSLTDLMRCTELPLSFTAVLDQAVFPAKPLHLCGEF